MNVVVKTHSEQQQQELIAFLESKKYDFSADDVYLTEEQQKEILRRGENLTKGITTARSWNEFIQDLKSVHR